MDASSTAVSEHDNPSIAEPFVGLMIELDGNNLAAAGRASTGYDHAERSVQESQVENTSSAEATPAVRTEGDESVRHVLHRRAIRRWPQSLPPCDDPLRTPDG